MQKPQHDVELKAVERAVKAGNAAVKSNKHVSKSRGPRRMKDGPVKNREPMGDEP
jgi:hypothetical protein